MYQMNLNSAIIDIGELIETTSDKKSYRGSMTVPASLAYYGIAYSDTFIATNLSSGSEPSLGIRRSEQKRYRERCLVSRSKALNRCISGTSMRIASAHDRLDVASTRSADGVLRLYATS